MLTLRIQSAALFTLLFLISFATHPAFAAEPAGPSNQPGPRPGQPGPWDNDVNLYRVAADGAVSKLATFERAGVPTLVRLKDGRLAAAHQWFPENDAANFDKVAIRFSEDDGKTWSAPRKIELNGLPENMRFPFDPTLVPLDDGRVRLYFTSLRMGAFNTPAIYSAISSDAVKFEVEPGLRFGLEGSPVIDCAATIHKGIFHLYSPHNGRQHPNQRPGDPQAPEDRAKPGVGYHATSTDGLNFTRADDVTVDNHGRWLGCVSSDGETITLYGTNDRPDGGMILVAQSSDGGKWEVKTSLRVPGVDCGVARAKDGALLVLATGSPRPGSPSANRMRNRQPPGAFGQ